MTFSYAWRLVVRNPRRTLTYIFGLALSVGLLAAILFFVDAASRGMNDFAMAPVRIDIMVHATTPAVNMDRVAATLVKNPQLKAMEPLTAADFASAVKMGGHNPSPAGRMFAINPDYFKTFAVLEMSQGKFEAKGVSVSEAMAVSQHLKLGDQLKISFAGLKEAVFLPVTGIVNMGKADTLFSSAVENENAVVADVLFVDLHWFNTKLEPQLAVLVAHPPLSLPPGATILDKQLHIRINRSLLSANPSRAALQVEGLRRKIERSFPGDIKATDNLSSAFKSAAADILSARILFIFLGLPGIALAAYLSLFAAELFAQPQRKEIGLLRTRGATPARILAIVATASVLLALGGSTLGIIFGVLLLLLPVGSAGINGLIPFSAAFDWNLFTRSALMAFGAGIGLSFFAAFLPAFKALKREVMQERKKVVRSEGKPFWKRFYLDLILLAVAALVLFITQVNGGFRPTGNEGTAISLSFYIFTAPFFAWIGLTLFILRIVERGLVLYSSLIAGFFRKIFGEIGEVAGRSVSRRASRVGHAVTIIALTLSFGVSLAIFQQTYSKEKQLDAQYVVGADIRFKPAINTPQPASFAHQLRLPGVRSVTAVARDTQALVGSEKNTVYGIDVASFRRTAYLPDSFFVDGYSQKTLDAMRNRTGNYAPGSANKVLDALVNTPNGVIISVEQAEKYNILINDPVLLRLYNRDTRKYSNIKAKTVGFFSYFPTSSQDSDFILNRDFMVRNSGFQGMDYFLIKTDGRPGSVQRVSQELAARYGKTMAAQVENINSVIKTEESSLTSLNLGQLGAMERFFTLLVASLGLAIFLLAMINERQREFGTMRALGGNLFQLRRFLFTEAFIIGGLSLVIGAAVGVGLARLLVLLLGVIFTIPAQNLIWPGPALMLLALLVIMGMLVSVFLSARRLSRLKVTAALREL